MCGGELVLVDSFMLLNIINLGSAVDWTALRWNVLVWDMCFLLMGVLMALANTGYRKRTA